MRLLKTRILFCFSLLVLLAGVCVVFSAHQKQKFPYPNPEDYAPNFWFDSEEEYYPCNPLEFNYDNDLNELPAQEAKEKYESLSKEEKLNHFTVFYNVIDDNNQWIYEYHLYYVFNDFTNQHYGDWEWVNVYVDKKTKRASKVIGSAHWGSETKIILANNELDNPKTNHQRILVEKGSHANAPDGNNDGLIESSDADNSNAYIKWPIAFQDWSLADKVYGKKMNWSDSRYKLVPMIKLEKDYSQKYPLQRKVVNKAESLGIDVLSLNPIIKKVLLDKDRHLYVARKLTGSPPENPWHHPQYYDPQIAEPANPILSALSLAQKSQEFVFQKTQSIAQFVEKRFKPFSSLFSSQVGSSYQISQDKTPNKAANKRLNKAEARTLSVLSKTEKKEERQAQEKEQGQKQEPEKQFNQKNLNSLENQIAQLQKQIQDTRKQIREVKAEEKISKRVQKAKAKKKKQLTQDQRSQFQKSQKGQEKEKRAHLPNKSSVTQGPIFVPGPPPDLTPPDTEIILHPQATTSSQEAVFEFQSNEKGDFQCSLDNQEWQFCSSPTRYQGLAEGSHLFQVRALDQAKNVDPTPAVFQWDVLLSGPSVSFNSLESPQSSLSFLLSWQTSEPERVKEYQIQYRIKDPNNDWQNLATTNETQYLFNQGQDETSYQFRVRSISQLNQPGDWSEVLEVKISLPKSVVINEIGWMGTKANPSDEWVELYNPSDQSIDLNGWRLKAEDGSPDIVFSEDAEISSQGYFLIERTDDNTISDIEADFLTSFGKGGLSNQGEILYLYDNQGNLVDLVNCSQGWFAGKASPYYVSMERKDAQRSGSDSENWEDNNLLVRNGRDKDNNKIYGTPKSENSLNQTNVFISNSSLQEIFSDFDELTLRQENSPFIVGNFTLPQGKTLILEPGVVFRIKGGKFTLNPIIIQGRFLAQGSSEKKIVFTSFYDPDYGGSGITKVSESYWQRIWLQEGSSESKFDNCVFKYGGYGPGQSYSIALLIEGVNPEIKDCLFEKMGGTSVKLINSSSSIENCSFQGQSYGQTLLEIEGGSPTVKNSTFKTGSLALEIKESSASIENNAFEDFQYDFGTIFVESSYPSFQGNSFKNNKINGITLTGDLEKDWTIGPNQTFLVRALSLKQGATLKVKPGTILKFFKNGSLTSQGALQIGEEGKAPVVFTSVADDEYGGDTNNDGNQTSPKTNDWQGINIFDAQNSFIKNAIFRYGGQKEWLDERGIERQGIIFLDNSQIELDSLLIENTQRGIYSEDSTLSVEDSRFFSCGSGYYCLSAKNSVLEVQNSSFEKSNVGLKVVYVQAGIPVLENVEFQGNNYGVILEKDENVPLQDKTQCPDLSSVKFKDNSVADVTPDFCLSG